MPRFSLSFRLLIWLVPILVGVLGISSYTNYRAAAKLVIEEVERGVGAFNEVAAAQVQSFFLQRKSDILTLADSPLFRDHYMNVEYKLDAEAESHRKEIALMLRRFADRTGAYTRVAYLDSNNRVLADASDDSPPLPLINAALLKELPPGTLYAARHESSGAAAPSKLGYGTAIRDEFGAYRGALVFDVSLDQVYAVLNELRLGSSAKSYLANRRDWQNGIKPTKIGERITSAAPVTGTEWNIVTTVDYKELLYPLRELGSWALLSGIAFAVLTILLVTRQVRVLLSPLTALAKTVREFGNGVLGARAVVAGPEEVASLAGDFNSMAARLNEQTDDLRRSESRYRVAIEQSPNAVIALKEDRSITIWNKRAEAIFGYTAGEAEGRSLDLILDREAVDELLTKADQSDTLTQRDIAGRTRQNRPVELSVNLARQKGEPGGNEGWFVVIEDVTDKKQLRARLFQAEKMTAVGNLIAGIAHELNNPLAAVTGFAELLKDLPTSPEEKEDLKHLRSSALRCRDIVQELLRFVRRKKSEITRIAVNELVHASVALLEYRIVKLSGIMLETDLDKSGPAVGADFQKLQQVLLNMLTNALDALEGKTGKRVIRVSTRAVDAGTLITVENSGTEIPPEIAANMFEPFVTSKPSGKGTGLGLSISRQIAEEFSGTLTLDDDFRGGARFILALPPCPNGLPVTWVDSQLPPPAPGKRVLVVDDDPEVARLMVRLLEEDGLRVEGFGDPREALRRLKTRGLDLVVSDVDMGDFNGAELLREILSDPEAERPAFIFVTGNVLNNNLPEDASALHIPVLAKPFLRSDFLRAVRRALGKATSSAG